MGAVCAIYLFGLFLLTQTGFPVARILLTKLCSKAQHPLSGSGGGSSAIQRSNYY